MQLARVREADGNLAIGQIDGDRVTLFGPSEQYRSLAELLESPDPSAAATALRTNSSRSRSLSEIALLAPIDDQEVWAAGVTYRRSQKARMDESEGAASFYDRVYSAQRPELFFKATPHRVSGPGQTLRIRQDSHWNVPEPELALVLNSRMDLVGFTVGNDMSSRDIEGENPLYLPQAKLYDSCCGLGPWITLALAMPCPDEIEIKMEIQRGGTAIYQGATFVGQMARSFGNLIDWLARDNSFPVGVILLTGTGIVPPDDLSLLAGDVVRIHITGIGMLENPVVQSTTGVQPTS